MEGLTFYKNNLCVKVARQNSEIDIVSIAQWINSQMRAMSMEVAKAQAPKVKKMRMRYGAAREDYPADSSVSAFNGQIGKQIEIKIDSPLGVDTERYIVKEWFDRNLLNVARKDDTWVITPRAFGVGVFKYFLIDKKTLLFTAKEITINIQQ